MKSIFVAVFLLSLITGCYYDNLEELHPNIAPCDTSGIISYTNDINPIMLHSCGSQDIACHNTDGSQSGYGLGTHGDLVNTVNSSPIFLQTIKHDPSISCSKWMPLNSSSKIDDCSIQKIEAWINRGMLNN